MTPPTAGSCLLVGVALPVPAPVERCAVQVARTMRQPGLLPPVVVSLAGDPCHPTYPQTQDGPPHDQRGPGRATKQKEGYT